MKKIISLLAVGALVSSLSAHDLWSSAKNGSVLKADMVYGHHFPQPEAIAKDRVKLFEPMKVVGDGYEETLTQKGENDYHFEGKGLKKGTYLVLSNYKPTAWIEKKDGKWEMDKTRKDTSEEVVYCGVSTMSGKMILVVDNDSGEFATKALGKGLEFTPMQKASKIKKDALVKFRLTNDGKPVKKASVVGSYGGYASNDLAQAFTATTDLNGEFEFRALKSGLWYLKTTLNTDSGDKNCETINQKASITFDVK
ncbi:DUF4198 domain-containing protein [Campylobacter geochelonis]|uniref:DUF4198 domain-containing protein n=1 Tax=Campylobacter geochelonis TaxID=1780362 RepID=UPI00077072E0|nr:DUF4198 domain-containing protein [Campylobacter geochelonis]CZE47362.1 Nickel uptake substrate-specific transmembrane region [Campylobacter geochelonis]CZE50566.1 Nickel uptake substrate-specific transmembrane region [Campylobacter geochelonis]